MKFDQSKPKYRSLFISRTILKLEAESATLNLYCFEVKTKQCDRCHEILSPLLMQTET